MNREEQLRSLRLIAEATRQANETLRDAVLKATASMSEVRIAMETGLSRSTVRAWSGKPQRGDRVRALTYYGNEPVEGAYRPRADFRDAQPPDDAAWIDDGSADGTVMVKMDSITVVK